MYQLLLKHILTMLLGMLQLNVRILRRTMVKMTPTLKMRTLILILNLMKRRRMKMKTHSVSKVSKLMTMESLLHLDVQIQNRQPVVKKITEDAKVKLWLEEPARTGVQI